MKNAVKIIFLTHLFDQIALSSTSFPMAFVWGLHCLPSPFLSLCLYIHPIHIWVASNNNFTIHISYLFSFSSSAFLTKEKLHITEYRLFYHPSFSSTLETFFGGEQRINLSKSTRSSYDLNVLQLLSVLVTNIVTLSFSLIYVCPWVVPYHTHLYMMHNVHKASCRIERKYLK